MNHQFLKNSIFGALFHSLVSSAPIHRFQVQFRQPLKGSQTHMLGVIRMLWWRLTGSWVTASHPDNIWVLGVVIFRFCFFFESKMSICANANTDCRKILKCDLCRCTYTNTLPTFFYLLDCTYLTTHAFRCFSHMACRFFAAGRCQRLLGLEL